MTVLVEVGVRMPVTSRSYPTELTFSRTWLKRTLSTCLFFRTSRLLSLTIDFFNQSPNILAKILPEYAEFSGIIKVIDVPSSFGGSYAHVIADAQTGKLFLPGKIKRYAANLMVITEEFFSGI